MKKGERDTVGKMSRDLTIKNEKVTHTPIDQMHEQLSDYEQNIEECLQRHKKDFDTDFYMVVLTKKEKLMKNVIRNYFYGRLSCPTPNYDQIVYKYHRKDDKLEFIWVIPDRETSKYMKRYQHLVDPSEWELLSNVLKFADGSFFRLAKELNGEEKDSPKLKDN